MLTGISYDDVLRDFSGDRVTEGLSDFTYDVWLNQRGYALRRFYRHYSPLHADRAQWPLEPFADAHLCQVSYPTGGHAVVLLRDGTVLDPARESPSRLSDYDDVSNMAGVYRVSDPFPPEELIGHHWSDGSRKCQWCGMHIDSYKSSDVCPARHGIITTSR